MATYEFNDKIKFILPAGFHISEGEDDEDDEGNEVVNIVAGEYEDDEGETRHKFSCAVIYSEYDPEEVDEAFTSETLLDWIAEQREESRRMKLPGTPKTMLFEQSLCISFANINIIEMSTLLGLVQVSDWSVLRLATVETLAHSQQENSERYEYFYELLKAIRINGKKLPIDSTSPSQIEAALQFASDEDDEEYLTRVTPDEELYPHYNNVLSAGGFGFLGASVVVNDSGTEYAFIPFRRAAENDEVNEDRRALYNRVIAKDTESYNLYEKAKEMQKLFHVNESAFDPRHDRECELEEGYMHKAYMMSGLRSFAWTLADNCKRHDCTPEDIDYTVASGIANFVADEDWLNYDGDSYCQGLCSGSDLHVFFVPDGVAQADKEKLLPSKEDKDRVKKMKEQLPSYREILTEVHSLNALRKDLAYIYPAVKTLWDSLKEDRNYDEALLGNEADIVYAWCALALAAKEPFFTEDGPMSCFFSHPDDEAALQTCWEAEESAPTSDDGKTIIFKEGQVAEEDCYIDSSNIFQHYTGSEKEIILPDGISAIGEMAFWYKTDITSVVIPEGVEIIENKAFYECHNLKTVVLPSSLRKIGDSAFYECEQLVKIVVPEGVETIENEAFYKCHNLKTVDLPSTLRKIGDSAFYECEQLTMIIIPEGCEKIDANAFWLCKNLKDIFVPSSVYEFGEDAFYFETIIHTKRDSVADRFLKENYFRVDYNGTLQHYTGSETEIILPDGFSTIGKYLFRNNFNITSVLIPEGFETIENDVFFSCHNMKTVVLPNSLRKIGDSAFWECEQLTKIVIPDGCEKIGAKAFLRCTKLKDIYVPSSVYEIGDAAFDTGNYATTIHTQKGSAAERFAKEHNLKVDYESVPTRDDDILPEKTVPPEKTEKVQISKNDCNIDSSGTFQKYIGSEKDIILPDGISAIGKIAFSNNFDITSVVIPEGVEIIEDGAFEECHDLETVVLPNSLREISENVFFKCHNLRTVILPDSLRKIGDSAFYECEQLTRLVVPEGVEIIENAAFCSCYNLKTVVLPNSLRKIGEDAFLDCKQLTRIVIPEGIEIVEGYVFNGCHNLKTVVLPNSLKEIGEAACFDCKQLTMIIIPEGCKKIGADAFSCCTNLKDIYVPSSVCEIGEQAFKTICGETIIHTQKGSAAESFAKEHNLKVDYEPVPTEEEEPVEEATPVPVEVPTAEEELASKETPTLVKSPSLADTSKSPEKSIAKGNKKILIKLFVILLLLIVGIFVGTGVIHKVQYKIAEDYYNSGKYEEAINFIDKSGQKDTEEMSDLYHECFYKLVENYMDSGEYLKALRCINSIGTDFNNTENENRYAQLEETCYEKLGQEAYDNKAYKTALDYYNQSANGAPEQFYYDYGLYLMSTKDYLAAIEMFGKCPSYNDSLDLIKECKYEYAKAHYTCNAATEAFLRELAGINYKDSKSLHDALFKWKMELVINTSEDDTSFAQSSTSPYSPIYVHYKVTNGPLYSSVTATIKWTTPTDSGTDSVTLSVGDTGWYGWTKGLYQRGYGASGTLTVTYCDDAGNVMGSASIEIKN